MATVAKSKPAVSADQVQRFERRLREVKQAIAGLPGEEYHAELTNIVRRAGWTTQAEGIFFEAVVESMLAHTRDLTSFIRSLRLRSRKFRENSGGIVWRDGRSAGTRHHQWPAQRAHQLR